MPPKWGGSTSFSPASALWDDVPVPLWDKLPWGHQECLGHGPALVRERSILCHSSAPHGVTCHQRLPLQEVIDSLPLPSPN